MINDGRFVDYNHIISYNALLNFIVGQRSGGKTYGWKKYAIIHYLKTGNQFIYLRRYKSDLKTVNKFFDDIINDEEIKKKELDLEVKGRKFYINNKECGYACALSSQQSYKSTPYPFVDNIGFDEFIAKPNGYARYIPDEVNEYKEFYETVARIGTDHPEVKMFFLGNLWSVVNPYFDYYNLTLPYEGKVIYKNDILTYQVKAQKMIDEKKKSRFYKIHGDDDYNKYATEGKVFGNDKEMVERKSGKCEYQFMLMFGENNFGVWYNYELRLYYISNDIDYRFPFKYTTDIGRHGENTVLVKRKSDQMHYRKFIDSYKNGRVRFESKEIKSKMLPWISRYAY